eukprot:5895622-Amphidinium_carterae.1
MPLCVRNSGVPHTMKNRVIQEAHNTESDSTTTYVHRRVPPGLAHLPPGGHKPYKKDEYDYQVNQLMPKRRIGTMWVMLFDM